VLIVAIPALEKLNKVLALADSGHDGEAMAALRAARTLLTSDGVSLSHVLQSAIAERRNEVVQVRGGVVVSLQKEVIHLQMQLVKAQRDLREQIAESHHWRKTAEDNARKLKKQAIDADLRQRRLNETARALAEIAKSIENGE
jgi:Protein of unknown function (DUF2786)